MDQKSKTGHCFATAAAKFCLLLITLSLWSCSPRLRAQESFGQVAIYLEKISTHSDSTLTFERLILQGEYASHEITLVTPRLKLQELSQQQILLAESLVDPGQYHSLILSLASNHVTQADSADSARRIISLPLNVSIEQGQAKALFLQWTSAPLADSNAYGRFRQVKKIIPPVTALAFVANEASDNLSVIDRIRSEVVGIVRVGAKPRGLAVSVKRNLLFVANAGSHNVSVLELNTRIPRALIDLDFGDEPSALTLSGDERLLFTANRGSNSVSIIDAFNFSRRDKISVGTAPNDIVADPASGWVYTANSLSDDISAFNATMTAAPRNLSVGSNPVSLELDAPGQRLYVANYGSGTITQINTETFTVSGTLNTTHSVNDLVSDARAGTLYCSIENLNLVAILKLALNLDINQIAVKSFPKRLALDPEGALLYVVCSESNNLSLIGRNAGQVKGVIATGLKPCAIVFP